jgi:hypothetical protein
MSTTPDRQPHVIGCLAFPGISRIPSTLSIVWPQGAPGVAQALFWRSQEIQSKTKGGGISFGGAQLDFSRALYDALGWKCFHAQTRGGLLP